MIKTGRPAVPFRELGRALTLDFPEYQCPRLCAAFFTFFFHRKRWALTQWPALYLAFPSIPVSFCDQFAGFWFFI